MNRKPIVVAFIAAGLGFSSFAFAAGEADRIAQLEKQLKMMQEQIEALKTTKASSQDVNDLKNQVEAQGKEAVVAGDIPGSFRIPGSDTSIRLYGIAELNYVKEFKGDNRDWDYASYLPSVPLDGFGGSRNRAGESYMHARTSRIGVEGAMPSPYGQLGVKVEGDFNNNRGGSNGGVVGGPDGAAGYTNGYQFRLRHAYLTMGPWLFGQTWGTFMDVDNGPETIDFNGPNGNTTIRQPMVRYTHQTPEYGNFIASLENSSSYVMKPNDPGVVSSDECYGQGCVYTIGDASAKNPDVVLRWDKPFTWGAVSLGVVSHELRLDEGSGGVEESRRGWGLRASGSVKAWGNDTFFWNVTGGDGIGRYMNGIEGAGYDANRQRIVLERAYGLTLGYQHRFNDQWRMNVVYGGQRSQSGEYRDWARSYNLDSAVTAGQSALNKKLDQFHVGAIWAPMKATAAGGTAPVEIGLEYMYGRRETIAGETGDMSRLNFLARYNFN